MIAAQRAKQIEELQRPFGSGFLSFLKASKPEIVNVFFAFVCVLLAYQIHGLRAGIRKLLAAQEEKDGEIDRLRGLLALLAEGESTRSADGDEDSGEQPTTFSLTLSQKCAEAVRRIFEQSEKKVGYSWILGRKIPMGDAMEVERLVDELQPVVLTEIKTVVGDAAFTPEELKELHVETLKADREIIDNLSSSGDSDVSKQPDQINGLMEMLEEVHNKDLTDGGNTGALRANELSAGASGKVKRTRYAI